MDEDVNVSGVFYITICLYSDILNTLQVLSVAEFDVLTN